MGNQPKFKSAFRLPDGLDTDDQITYSVGALIYVWSGCESAFMFLLRCLIGKGEDDSAQIIWLTNQNINNKLQLVIHICRTKNIPEVTVQKIVKFAKTFKSISKTRNMYCHGYHGGSEEVDGIRSLEYAVLDSADSPNIFSHKRKIPDKKALQELVATIVRAEQLFVEMHPTLIEVHNLSEAYAVAPPELPPQYR